MVKILKVSFILSIVLFVFCGCGKKEYSEEEIGAMVELLLLEKYEQEFDVLSVTEKNAGMNFADLYYVARCKDAEGRGPFLVGIEKDGSHMRDNYEGYLYKDGIDAELLEILRKPDSMSFWNYGVTYSWSQNKSGSFRNYVESGNVTLDTDISVNASTMSEAADAVFDILDALQRRGYGACIKFYWKDISLIFNRDGTGPEITRQYVDERFQDELHSAAQNAILSLHGRKGVDRLECFIK